MYSEKVIDHFMNPRNVGEIENADGVGTVGNAKCGDIMRIFLKVENDIITDVKFKTFGCGTADCRDECRGHIHHPEHRADRPRLPRHRHPPERPGCKDYTN